MAVCTITYCFRIYMEYIHVPENTICRFINSYNNTYMYIHIHVHVYMHNNMLAANHNVLHKKWVRGPVTTNEISRHNSCVLLWDKSLGGFGSVANEVEEVDFSAQPIDKLGALLVAVLREGVRHLTIHPSHHATERVVVAVLSEHLAQL